MTQTLEHEQTLALLQAMPMGVIATDKDRILSINRQAENLTGLNAAALCGQSIETLPHWLKSLFFSGKEQTLYSGESGCEVLVTLKRFSSGAMTMACFLSDSSELNRLRAKIHELEREREILVTRDDSSGLLNQRGLYQAIESQVSRSRRYGNTLSLISMQVDDYGERDADRDAVIEALGYLFNDRLRWADSVGRIGDDEFILVLPETDPESAIQLADKLSNELQRLRLRDEGKVAALTVRFGIAAWQDGDDPSRLLLRCQEARQQALGD